MQGKAPQKKRSRLRSLMGKPKLAKTSPSQPPSQPPPLPSTDNNRALDQANSPPLLVNVEVVHKPLVASSIPLSPTIVPEDNPFITVTTSPNEEKLLSSTNARNHATRVNAQIALPSNPSSHTNQKQEWLKNNPKYAPSGKPSKSTRVEEILDSGNAAGYTSVVPEPQRDINRDVNCDRAEAMSLSGRPRNNRRKEEILVSGRGPRQTETIIESGSGAPLPPRRRTETILESGTFSRLTETILDSGDGAPPMNFGRSSDAPQAASINNASNENIPDYATRRCPIVRSVKPAGAIERNGRIAANQVRRPRVNRRSEEILESGPGVVGNNSGTPLRVARAANRPLPRAPHSCALETASPLSASTTTPAHKPPSENNTSNDQSTTNNSPAANDENDPSISPAPVLKEKHPDALKFDRLFDDPVERDPVEEEKLRQHELKMKALAGFKPRSQRQKSKEKPVEEHRAGNEKKEKKQKANAELGYMPIDKPWLNHRDYGIPVPPRKSKVGRGGKIRNASQANDRDHYEYRRGGNGHQVNNGTENNEFHQQPFVVDRTCGEKCTQKGRGFNNGHGGYARVDGGNNNHSKFGADKSSRYYTNIDNDSRNDKRPPRQQVAKKNNNDSEELNYEGPTRFVEKNGGKELFYNPHDNNPDIWRLVSIAAGSESQLRDPLLSRAAPNIGVRGRGRNFEPRVESHRPVAPAREISLEEQCRINGTATLLIPDEIMAAAPVSEQPSAPAPASAPARESAPAIASARAPDRRYRDQQLEVNALEMARQASLVEAQVPAPVVAALITTEPLRLRNRTATAPASASDGEEITPSTEKGFKKGDCKYANESTGIPEHPDDYYLYRENRLEYLILQVKKNMPPDIAELYTWVATSAGNDTKMFIEGDFSEDDWNALLHRALREERQKGQQRAKKRSKRKNKAAMKKKMKNSWNNNGYQSGRVPVAKKEEDINNNYYY